MSDCVLEFDELLIIENLLEFYVDEFLVDEDWIVNYKKEKEEKD